MPEAQVWDFFSVPLLPPYGRQTLPCVGRSLGLAASFLLFFQVVADLCLMSFQNLDLLSISQRQML